MEEAGDISGVADSEAHMDPSLKDKFGVGGCRRTMGRTFVVAVFDAALRMYLES